MATFLGTDGSRRRVTPKQPPSFQLKELQELIGGYIEVVMLPGGKLLVINEEGKLLNFPYNVEATMIAAGVLQPGEYIVGPAVLMTREEMGE